jgi:inner membrane protein
LPTIITHAIVASGAGKIFARGQRLPARFWYLSILCSVLPDADIIRFSFGIHYSHVLGHRGFFHSIFFALLLSFFVVITFFRDCKLFSKKWWLYISYFFLVGASHGILDAFTNGGLGIALFSPFDTRRYFFPWRPIMVSPIGFQAFISDWGARVIICEAIYVWLPLVILVIAFRIMTCRVHTQGQINDGA